MKKIIAIVLLVVMMISVFALAVSAEMLSSRSGQAVRSLVVLGDSISTGYGLEGTIYTRASYANAVAAALGLSADKGYVNYAVDGYTSEDILALAKKKSSEVAGADLILLTCGGNDVLGKMLGIALSVTGSTTLTQAAMAMMMSPDVYAAKLYSAENLAVVSDALTQYRTNLTSLVSYLRKTAPKARIVFLTQYNPLSGVSFAPALDSYAEDVLGRLNTIMADVATAGNCETVDTHAVMVGKGLELSNIMISDIHPNAKGHAAIAEMVKTYLNIPESAETEDTTVITTATTTKATTTKATTTKATTTKATTTKATTTKATTTKATTTAGPVVTTTSPIITTTVTTTVTTTKATTTAAPVVTTTQPVMTTTLPSATTTTQATTTAVLEVNTETTTATTQSTPVSSEATTTHATSESTAADTTVKDETPKDPPKKGISTPVLIGIILFVVGVGAGTGIALYCNNRYY